MITCVQSTSGVFSCDNCNRKTPMILAYQFINTHKEIFQIKTLCEDCSNSLGNLHHKVMYNGIAHKYHMDEISEVKD